MNRPAPDIGVVIIGVNAAAHVGACISAVRAADYPPERLSIVYVDGGSRDDSARVAAAFDGVQVIELRDRHPTPGRGRNAGWRALSTPLIQFLDADTELHPAWFQRALDALDDETAAVCGHRREKHPDRNRFHRLTDMEWHYPVGVCRYFGGDVLIRRAALERTGGFDESLVAGEDPELSYRVRHQAGRIVRIDAPMTTHDIAMRTLRQYARRALRSGYAYAEIGLRFSRAAEKLWLRELLRIVLRALAPLLLVVAGLLAGHGWLGLLAALLLLGRPLFGLGRLKRTFGQTWPTTVLYAVHAALVVFPQFAGVVRFCWGRLTGRPLQNQGLTVADGRPKPPNATERN